LSYWSTVDATLDSAFKPTIGKTILPAFVATFN
jgi:hypothetical protein